MRRAIILDLIFTNKERQVENVKIKGSLGCNDHELAEFKTLKAVWKARSQT